MSLMRCTQINLELCYNTYMCNDVTMGDVSNLGACYINCLYVGNARLLRLCSVALGMRLAVRKPY